jgi:hypothetical protein
MSKHLLLHPAPKSIDLQNKKKKKEMFIYILLLHCENLNYKYMREKSTSSSSLAFLIFAIKKSQSSCCASSIAFPMCMCVHQVEKNVERGKNCDSATFIHSFSHFLLIPSIAKETFY